VPKRTLQRWHDRGFLVASAATGGGRHRRYTESDLRRARVMGALKRLGFGGRRASSIADVLGPMLG
jgi:DNA-binding transcriptional MerR regulator